jgi:hypothetical protein
MRCILLAAALLGLAPLATADKVPEADPAVDAGAEFKQHLVSHYHTPSDDMKLPVHWPSFARLARVIARIGLGMEIGDATLFSVIWNPAEPSM